MKYRAIITISGEIEADTQELAAWNAIRLFNEHPERFTDVRCYPKDCEKIGQPQTASASALS